MAVGACLYIDSMYAHKIINYRHTKYTQTDYTNHIRTLIAKVSLLFFLVYRTKQKETHISIYQMNLVNSLRTATFYTQERPTQHILNKNSHI